MTADCFAETTKMRKQWHNVTKVLTEKTNKNSIPMEISFFVVSSCFLLTHIQLLAFQFVDAIGQMTFATKMSVQMAIHKNFSTTFM